MPSKNMLPKGKRRRTVKHDYRIHREAQRLADETAAQASTQVATAVIPGIDEPVGTPANVPAPQIVEGSALPELEYEDGLRSFTADATAAVGKRLDAYLAKSLPEISRARVQLLIEGGQVRVNGKSEKASLKLLGGERIEIEGEPQPPPLKAEPEDIPLNIVYEDDDLAVIDKPAGMTVHAGAGDAEHNRGTLVNALLFHFGQARLSSPSGDEGTPRPGIVHRLDKETSGLIVVAKNDTAHRKLSEMFASRSLRKVYLTLVHGTVAKDEGTIDLPIGRDPVRRIRMTARRSLEQGARSAVSHWRVLERIGSKMQPGTLGPFTLLEVAIETGRTHQIRVHLAAIGHPVVGDTMYGAPGRLKRLSAASHASQSPRKTDETEPTLERNFLHAAELSFAQPRTGRPLELRSSLPPALEAFLASVRG